MNSTSLTVGPDGFISHTYNPGYVVLSYIVSLTGCWTSLELLHRRTGARGYYNWYLLLAAACSMGAVAIWCMHFIGNRAITMDKGQDKVQIQYSIGYTAGSFFDPIVVVGLAFYFFSISERVSILGTGAGGLLTGTAVCGMHYMGQGGITNYHSSYSWPYVLGSAIVAVVASTIALVVFFHLKSTWTNSWWKRGLCASFLASAVSGMHWIATVGTSYRVKPHHTAMAAGLSREITVIVVICLCIGCCFVLMAFALIGQRSRRRSKNRAQQVVLACATFDPEGRLMVTPEGLLPCRKITDCYTELTFEDVFDVGHPVFCWIFRASRCWRSVATLVPSIRAHVHSSLTNQGVNGANNCDTRRPSVVTRNQDYSTLFKELFCVAAKDLAGLLQIQLEEIGVLFGKIMSTGTLSKTKKLKLRGFRYRRDVLELAERGESPMHFGRGQLLFVVRQANRAEASRLQAIGHRFAIIPNVVDHLARSMEVTREELLPQLESMCDASADEHLLAPGVYLACFALRPVFHRGFHVLVRREANHLLPTAFLSKSRLEQWQISILERMDNLTVATCCDLLRAKSMLIGEREHIFAEVLLKGILQLAEAINDPFFGDARLVARTLKGPCSSSPRGCKWSQHAFMINFRCMTDAHQQTSLNDRYEYAPLKFFLCQQHAYKESPDNSIFARKVHREFAALAKTSQGRVRQSSTNSSNVDTQYSSIGSFGSLRGRSPSPVKKKVWPTRVQFKGFDFRNDDSSEKNLVDPASIQPYGGIHVSNEIDVDISEVSRPCNSPDIEMRELGFHSEVGVGDVEQDSFADVLVTLTIDERKKQHMIAF